MTPDPVAIAVDLLALPDDDFFAIDAAGLTALQSRLAKAVQPPPLSLRPSDPRQPLAELRVIGAPAELDWSRRASFPLLLAEIRGHRREWAVHALQNRLLMMSNLDTGAVDLMAPLDHGRRMPELEPSRGGPEPDAFNAALSSIGVHRYDLSRWFTRDQARGRLAITVFDYDLPSNTVHVLGRAASAPPPPDLAAWQTTRVAAQAAPTTPGRTGVSIQAPPRVAPDAPAILRAEVRLPRSRVTVLGAAPGSGHPFVLAASLLLVRLDDSTPVVVHLYAPAAPGGDGHIEASFDLDLRHALHGRAPVGHWLAYLVVGDALAGPSPLTVG